jgi:hypothetical protein
MYPPPSPGWAKFSIMMECTPESGRCYSVFSVAITFLHAAPIAIEKITIANGMGMLTQVDCCIPCNNKMSLKNQVM